MKLKIWHCSTHFINLAHMFMTISLIRLVPSAYIPRFYITMYHLDHLWVKMWINSSIGPQCFQSMINHNPTTPPPFSDHFDGHVASRFDAIPFQTPHGYN